MNRYQSSNMPRPERLPPSAAWRHVRASNGFETVFFEPAADGGHRISGVTAAAADGRAWAVGYELRVAADWSTRSAYVWRRSEDGMRETRIELGTCGRWTVDGLEAPSLDGCLDVDLESSACTNLLPLRRTNWGSEEPLAAPAAYVRVEDLRVERLEQTYTRLPLPQPEAVRYQYVAPAFQFSSELTVDRSGLVVNYPGIAVRAL